MNRSIKNYGICFIVVSFLFTVFISLTETSADNFPPSYIIQKSDEPIKVDGKMDESVWAKTPEMSFMEIQHGSIPPFRCYGKMLWDDNYLYVGYWFEDFDVWASLTKDMPEPVPNPNKKDEYINEYIMRNDGFAKLFFDPDGDGMNYIEVHINALNKVDDGYLPYPYRIIGKEHGWYTEYNFEGLKTAVFVDGVINDQRTPDKSWSIEVAFPWKSLKKFTKGNCPPAPGDIWRAHMGRVWKRGPKDANYYYTWPVIGVVDCHVLPRWGYVIFGKQLPEIIY